MKDETDYLSDGFWLVEVDGGSRSYIPIKPDYPELDAALKTLKNELTQGLLKESEIKPKVTILSKKERKAWDAYEKIMGDEKPTCFYYDSIHDIVHNACENIHKKTMNKKRRSKKAMKKPIKNTIKELSL